MLLGASIQKHHRIHTSNAYMFYIFSWLQYFDCLPPKYDTWCRHSIRQATGSVRSSETFLFPVSFFPTLFSSTFNSLSIYFLVARGPPLGPKFRKMHSPGKWLGRLGASWPHLGPIFRIFEPPERHQKFMFFLHRSKRPTNR